MSELKNKLIKSCENLDFINFIKNFNEYEKKYGTLNFCLLTPILKNYSEDNRNNNIFEIKKFISVIIDDMFVFDDEILKKRGNEVIDFFEIYNKIGLNYSNDINGNNILHSQVKGLNYDGIKFLLEKGASPFILNNKSETPIETLFFYNYKNINLSEKEIINKKEKIAFLLLNSMKKNINLNFEKKLLINTIENKINQNENYINDIFIIKNIFKINNFELKFMTKNIFKISENNNFLKDLNIA